MNRSCETEDSVMLINQSQRSIRAVSARVTSPLDPPGPAAGGSWPPCHLASRHLIRCGVDEVERSSDQAKERGSYQSCPHFRELQRPTTDVHAILWRALRPLPSRKNLLRGDYTRMLPRMRSGGGVATHGFIKQGWRTHTPFRNRI